MLKKSLIWNLSIKIVKFFTDPISWQVLSPICNKKYQLEVDVFRSGDILVMDQYGYLYFKVNWFKIHQNNSKRIIL